MLPKLERNLVVFDLETTGLDLATAHIIQISYIIVHPDGTEERGNQFINPGMPIPKEVQELTHITDDMVKDQPTFPQIAQELQQKFANADFAGYNSNFYDVPLLCEEFLRCGIIFDFSKCRLIDACTIFKQMERRNLAAAYKFYTGRKMEDDFQAHLADQDTEATWAVLKGQLDMYQPGKQEEPERQLDNDMDTLHEFCNQKKNVDFAGRLIYNEQGEEIVNFGKYKGRRIRDVFATDPGYYGWVMGADFTLNTKYVFKQLWLKYAGR